MAAMKVSYNGLWKIMIDKGLQKQDLVNKAGLSSATVAKMGKGEAVINAVLHNQWVSGNEPMISVFSDRIEILSRGTIPLAQTIEGFYLG